MSKPKKTKRSQQERAQGNLRARRARIDGELAIFAVRKHLTERVVDGLVVPKGLRDVRFKNNDVRTFGVALRVLPAGSF